jgi:phosphoglycolate phosphatase
VSSQFSRPKAIIFDWDNTLVDSWKTIHQALNATLTNFGLEPWSLEYTKANVQKSMRDSFPGLFGNHWEKAGEFFYEQYEAIHIETLSPLEGAEQTLVALRKEGIYLAVVSNKKGNYLRQEVTHLGWDTFFGQIVGALDAEQDKPAIAPVKLALNRSGVNEGSVIWFAGDSQVDLECAHNSNCVPILIRKKEPEALEFKDYPPDMHIRDCPALLKLLDTL